MGNKNKNVATDSLKLSIAQIFSLIISMINIMLLSRFRTVTEYGTYSQMLMVSALVVTFFASGFSQCINYFLANEKDDIEKNKFIKSYYFIITLAGLISGIISLTILPLLVKYFSNELLYKYWFFLLLYPLSNVLNNGADRFFVLYRKTNQLMLFKLRYGFTTLLTVTLAIVLNWTFSLYLHVFVLVEFTFGILIYFFIYKITGVIPFGFNIGTCKKILMFAIPMGIAALIATLDTELDKLVIGGLTDTEMLAVYTNAAKELPVTVFSTSISTVVMPFIVRNIQNNNNSEAAKLWSNSIKFSAYIMCFFMVAFFVFAPQVISVLYSDKYISGTNIFRIYLLLLPFRLTYYGMILNSCKKTKVILLSSVCTLVINIVLDYVLYFFIGITGPAWATVISVAMMNMVQLIFTKRLINVSFWEIYPVAHILKVLVINIILGMFFFLIQNRVFYYCNFNHNFLTICLGGVWLMVYIFLVRKKMLCLWHSLNQ